MNVNVDVFLGFRHLNVGWDGSFFCQVV